ncbi:MAG: acyltransferase, partial [Lacisediminimonas sp.]|nr:acyltransferase [Lacisediminimonas sp.]
AMGDKFHSLIDVTIVYPAGAPSFWQFLCGDTPRVIVRVRALPIPPAFCTGDYAEDAAFRDTFQRWLSQLWQEKDAQIEALLHGRNGR